MPLLDHFHPPLSQRRHWESFHSGWAEAMALALNRDLLPERYVAEVQFNVGPRIATDVGTLQENGEAPARTNGGIATWAPSRPTAVAPLDFQSLDTIEVQIFNEEQGPRLVAAIELISPANKDRATHRQMFAIKCAAYLQANVNVVIVDVVTERSGNLHRELLNLLHLAVETLGQEQNDLYSAAYRPVNGEDAVQLETWAERLTLGESLHTMPLWIEERICLPLDLEETYLRACEARRIHVE